MKQIIIRITLLVSCLFLTPALFARSVDVYIPPDVLADYHQFLAGRSPETIRDYSGPMARRDVIEVVLFMQAIARSDRDWQVNFVEQPDYGQMLIGLEKGEAIASVTSLWRKDLTTRWGNLYITTAVIERGQFEAGFYTAADNRVALSSQTDFDLRRLKGVSSEAWVIDWKTLTSFGADVRHTDTWGEMVAQVTSGESDYLLAPFQATDDLRLELAEGTLMPIPGVKIGLLDTRHFAVSRAHPAGWDFNIALHSGLMALKKEGLVNKAYADCGFLNAHVQQWRDVSSVPG